MIPSSSAVLRACFLGTSTALHVAAFAMTGHRGGARGGEAPMVDVAIAEALADLDEPTVPVAPTDEDVPRAAPPRSATAVRAAHVLSATQGSPPREAATAPAAAPQVETTVASARFTFVVSNQLSTANAVSAQGDSHGTAPAADDAPLAEGEVSSPARLTGSLVPAYPPAARAQEVEADVVLSIVVSPTGRVTEARVVRAAGYGFDDAAQSAMRQARFVPAFRQGRSVAVRMRWTVAFRLR